MVYTQQGDKMLTLLWNPHSNMIPSDTLFVELANRWLYTMPSYNPVRDTLQEIHPHTWGGLSRFDIATDFIPDLHQMAIIEGLQAGDIYVQGKREGSQFHTYKQGLKVHRVPKCMSWGSPYTAVKFKLYNKSKEIYETDPQGRKWCNKPYIAEYWAHNGLNTGGDVWRLEVSITNASSHQWRGEKLDWSETDAAEYTSLFYDLVKTRWCLRKNEGHPNKRYDTPVPFLLMPDTTPYRLRRLDPRTEQHHTDHAATLRNLIKELDKCETKCNRDIANSLLSAAMNIVEVAKLGNYFRNTFGKSFDQYAQEYYAELP